MVCIWERWCEICKAHEQGTGGSAIHARHCTDHFQSFTAAQRGQSRENLGALCFPLQHLCGVRRAHEKGLQKQIALSVTHTQCVVGGIWALAHVADATFLPTAPLPALLIPLMWTCDGTFTPALKYSIHCCMRYREGVVLVAVKSWIKHLLTRSLYFPARAEEKVCWARQKVGGWIKPAEGRICCIHGVNAIVLPSLKVTVKNSLSRCLDKEIQRWKEDKEPEKLNGHFQSELLGIFVIQVIQSYKTTAAFTCLGFETDYGQCRKENGQVT